MGGVGMLNVFIPHRWNNDDFEKISNLLDRSKYKVRDYSIPKSDPLPSIDRRYKLDPQIQRQIDYASVVVCSNRPANANGVSMEEINYAVYEGKPIVAVKITTNSSCEIIKLGIPVIAYRKDSLDQWIRENVII